MVPVVDALLRLLGVAFLAAAGWSLSVTAGLAATGLGLLGLTYLPDDTQPPA